MAKLLAEGLQKAPGMRLMQPVQANMVFAFIPPAKARSLQREFAFHVTEGIARLVTAFDTREEDVRAFVSQAQKE
jgi:threonine aldolase